MIIQKKLSLFILILLLLVFPVYADRIIFNSDSTICFSPLVDCFFGGDVNPSNITLINPQDRDEDTDGSVNFVYSVSSLWDISNCSLIFDDEVEVIDKSITKDIDQSFFVENIVEKDRLEWSVSCVDQFENQGNSSTRVLDTKLGGSGFGGGGGAPFVFGESIGIRNISSALCNITYNSLLEFGIDNAQVNNIQKEFNNLTNQTVDVITVKTYQDNWQPLCSDLINRTLRPSFFCNKLFDFVGDNSFSKHNSL